MASKWSDMEAEEVPLSALDRFGDQLVVYRDNFNRNFQESLTGMSLQSWIRLVVIIGGYMLLRPYVMKWFAKDAVKQMEQNDAKDKAMISANELRGEKAPASDLNVDDEGDGTAADWGQRARTRQRVMLKNLLEAEERRREEEDDLKDIEDLLED